MTSIFNSLGSNYDGQFVWQAVSQLWSRDKHALPSLTELLEKKNDGKAFLFYKGRDAIEFAARVLNLSQEEILFTQAFTCHAIEEAAQRAQAAVQFVDLAEGELNPSVDLLERSKTATQRKVPKALLIQHTLGIPAEIRKIAEWCHQNNVVLIEDLAQALGGRDDQGQKFGSVSDIVIYSFGRDKIIDAVSGGAVVFKRQEDIDAAIKLYDSVEEKLPGMVVVRDMVYPLLTAIIRQTLSVGIGKIIFKLAKITGWLTSPIASPTKVMTKMAPAYAHLALLQWKNIDHQLAHRKKIAEVYDQEFASSGSTWRKVVQSQKVAQGSNLRYSLWVEHPDAVTKLLTQQQIYITDRWYRKPVDFGSLNKKTSYLSGSCPTAEELAKHIINLPTHLHILAADARRIASAIKNTKES